MLVLIHDIAQNIEDRFSAADLCRLDKDNFLDPVIRKGVHDFPKIGGFLCFPASGLVGSSGRMMRFLSAHSLTVILSGGFSVFMLSRIQLG